MASIDTLTTLIGWCTVINLGILLFVFAIWSQTQTFFSSVFAGMFGVSESTVKDTVFRIFMQYRLLWAFFNLVPYIALKFGIA